MESLLGGWPFRDTESDGEDTTDRVKVPVEEAPPSTTIVAEARSSSSTSTEGRCLDLPRILAQATDLAKPRGAWVPWMDCVAEFTGVRLVAVDDDTAVPQDVFNSLLRAGKMAKRRGQHVNPPASWKAKAWREQAPRRLVNASMGDADGEARPLPPRDAPSPAPALCVADKEPKLPADVIEDSVMLYAGGLFSQLWLPFTYFLPSLYASQ